MGRAIIEMLYVFMSCLALQVLVYGQDQLGFISIDCGIAEEYTDETTSISYVPDEKFINTGTNENVSIEFMSKTLPQIYSNVRSFPQGAKNCYNLQLTQGKDNKYLIRASFMYGNYDTKGQLPEFKLYLGVNEWDTVTFQNAADIVTKEIIHVPTTDFIYVCLLKIGSTTPFISALELRQLNNSIYETQSGLLVLSLRYDVGSTTNQMVRYKDDAYDRIWEPVSISGWEPISATYTSGILSDSIYKLPASVMKTAVVPADGSSLVFTWYPTDPNQEFFVYLHFAEVQTLQANQLRKFNITLNGGHWMDPFNLYFLNPISVVSTFPVSGTLTFSINMVEESTLPPILNALEIYGIIEFLQQPTNQDDVDAIEKIKSVYNVNKDWQGDPCAPINYSWDGLGCSNVGYNSPRIISLNLSSSKLEGEIDSSFSNLKSLEYLDLSYNGLTGQVPEFLSQLPSLKTLNLSGNNLRGSVPSSLIDRSNQTLFLSIDNNPGLCYPNPCEKKNIIFPIVASIASLLVLLGALALLWCLKRRRQQGFFLKSNKEDGTFKSRNRQFTYSEVVSITNNFQKVIGKGGFGTVYSGNLKDGTQVAVKLLSPSSSQGSKEFKTEMELLTRVHHRNLASLIGYCDEGSNMALIYEYMANGNLQDHLADSNAAVLSWEQRLEIAVDTAQALEYLHNGCKPPIIHRDVKTANILLNEKLQAKVADFGLCRILPFESETHVSTAVVGTRGYLDPEYYISKRLNKKSDVYSFGIVLLELISGHPAILRNQDNTHIVQWANPILARGDIRQIVDPRLRGDFDTNSVWKAVETAMACVPSTSIQRPNMSQVVVELKECLEMEIANKRNLTEKFHSETSGSSIEKISVEMIIMDVETSQGPQAR